MTRSDLNLIHPTDLKTSYLNSRVNQHHILRLYSDILKENSAPSGLQVQGEMQGLSGEFRTSAYYLQDHQGVGKLMGRFGNYYH